MSLSAYTIRTGRVPLGKDNEFEVRALTFPDIAAMATTNMPSLIAIVAKYQEAREDVISKQNMGQLATMVAKDFPNLASEIISACIHNEPVTDDIREKVRLLPAPIQMMALLEIARITVEEAGGLGNLMSDFRQRVQDAVTAGQSDPSPTQNA